MNIFNIRSCMLLLLTGMLTACNLDMEPENTYVDEKVYRTEKTAQAALAGCYVRLNVFLSGAPQDQNNYANAAYTYELGDLSTDNLKVRATSATYVAVEKSAYTSSEHDTFLYKIWHWGYNAIDYANNVISGIERYGKYADATKRRHIAEAKFIRAYTYFGLLTMFGDKALLGNDSGDGVVLVLEPYKGYDPDKPQARSTNAECWAQIIRDLNEAIADLPETVPAASERIRATKPVAQSLLSRVYLYKGTYTNNTAELRLAADNANSVLQQQSYVFSDAPSEFADALFPSNEFSQTNGYPNPTARSSELIFYEPSRLFTANYPNGMSYYRKVNFYVPQSMINLYDEADLRRSYLIRHGSASDNPNDYTTAKYLGGQYDDVIYIRLSEIKLNYAEALVRASGSVSAEAVSQLNDIHQRAYPAGKKPARYTVADFPDATAFLRALLKERRMELAYEGQYRWDLMRTDNLAGDATLGAIPPARWNLPVPEYEIRLTGGLIRQNSGYAQ
ncbi:MAG: RagB/SusD family nutrient uptake outer membrane protein [Prevotella sp.]|nr:RagB/SusD family nutrient uptake outer membrane protein [Prevotella sp.]